MNRRVSCPGKVNSTMDASTERTAAARKQRFSMASTRSRRPAPQLYPTAGCSESHMPYRNCMTMPSAYIRIP